MVPRALEEWNTRPFNMGLSNGSNYPSICTYIRHTSIPPSLPPSLHACMLTCISCMAHIRTRMHTYLGACICMCNYIIYTHFCTYASVYVHVCTCTYLCICVRACICICMATCTTRTLKMIISLSLYIYIYTKIQYQ